MKNISKLVIYWNFWLVFNIYLKFAVYRLTQGVQSYAAIHANLLMAGRKLLSRFFFTQLIA